MTPFTYCAQCWPADEMDHLDGHCGTCGAGLTTTTDSDLYIALLEQQRDALAEGLSDAMEWLEQAGVRTVPRRPVLRLIHVNRESRQ